MFNTDTITIQTATDVNTLGSIKRTWADSSTIACDVQDISKELAYKKYGFNESVDYKEVYATNTDVFVIGNEVKYDGKQWLVRKIDTWDKINGSNNTKVILSRVV